MILIHKRYKFKAVGDLLMPSLPANDNEQTQQDPRDQNQQEVEEKTTSEKNNTKTTGSRLTRIQMITKIAGCCASSTEGAELDFFI